MDLLVPIISGLGILGYSFNKNGKNPRSSNDARVSIDPSNKNSAINTYSSVYSKEATEMERQLANQKAIQARDPSSSNVIPPFYNTYGNTVTNENSVSPVTSISNGPVSNVSSPASILPQLTNTIDPQQMMKNKVNSIMNSPMFNTQLLGSQLRPTESGSGGFTPIIKEAFSHESNGISELSGTPFDNNNNFHNNMVPFFGGSLKQNVDNNKSFNILDKHTGNDRDLQTHKMETPSFFEPVKQNIYGTKADQDRSRFYQSNKKNNIVPLPQIKEAPLPPDAFRGQYKTINQLQVKQRVTNRMADPIEGNKAVLVSQPLAYNKNRPETAYVSGIQRTFVRGKTKQSQRLNYQNGKESYTENTPQIPSAFAGQGYTKSGTRQVKIDSSFSGGNVGDALDEIDNLLISLSTEDHRKTDQTYGFRNTGTAQNSKYNEIARKSYKPPNQTERDTTSASRINGATQFTAGKGYRNNQKSKTTTKETTLYSYTGSAMNLKGNLGEQGKSTKRTNRLTTENYLATPNASGMQYRETGSFENTEIKSNRENFSNTGNYAISLESEEPEGTGRTRNSTCSKLGGISVPIGKENVSKARAKRGINEENYREYGNYGNINQKIERDDSTYGINRINSSKLETETDRIGDIFIKQLTNNEYNIDIKKAIKVRN
jgi:hypothetical protein